MWSISELNTLKTTLFSRCTIHFSEIRPRKTTL